MDKNEGYDSIGRGRPTAVQIQAALDAQAPGVSRLVNCSACGTSIFVDGARGAPGLTRCPAPTCQKPLQLPLFAAPSDLTI